MDDKEFERFNTSSSKERRSSPQEDRQNSGRDSNRDDERKSLPRSVSDPVVSEDTRDRRRDYSSRDLDRHKDQALDSEYSGEKREREYFDRHDRDHDRESPPRKRRREDYGGRDWPSEEGSHSRGGRRSNGPSYEERPSYATSRPGRGDWDDYEESPGPRRDFAGRDFDLREREHPPNRGGGYSTNRRSNWTRDILNGPMKSFQQFCDYLDESPHSYEAKRRYEEYKREFNKKNSRQFFRDHMKEEWFKEKYHPTVLEKRRLQRIETARKEAQLFAEELLQGKLHTNINADDHPELLRYVFEEKGDGVEDVEVFEESNLSLGEKDTKRESDVSKKDETESASEKPTTPQPTQSETSLLPTATATSTMSSTTNTTIDEKSGSEKQSNTETQQGASQSKELRVTSEDNKEGSLKDGESEKKTADMPTTSDEQTTKSPRPLDTISQSGKEKDKDKEASTLRSSRQQQYLQPREPNTLFIKTIPPTCSREELLSVLSKVQGGELKRLIISQPNPYKHFHRVGWVTYTTEEAAQHALKELSNYKMKDFDLMLIPHKGRQLEKTKITPAVAGTSERIQHDLGQAKQLMKQLDREKGILPTDNILLKREEEDVDTNLTAIQRLDRYLAYLRRVHCFCYYCGEEYIDADDVLFRCGEIHLRGTEAHHSNQDPKDWEDMIDTKIKQRIDKPDNPDFYTGKNLTDRLLEEFYASKIHQIEEAKFRCELCHKLFRGAEFVKKHLHNKHPNEIETVKQHALEEQYYENYLNDPKRILPSQVQFPQSSSRQHAPPPPPRQQRSGQWGQQQQQQRSGVRRGRGRGPIRRDEPEHIPSMDPRGLIKYTDLDAPKEEPLEIDFTKALKELINEKNKLRSEM